MLTTIGPEKDLIARVRRQIDRDENESNDQHHGHENVNELQALEGADVPLRTRHEQNEIDAQRNT